MVWGVWGGGCASKGQWPMPGFSLKSYLPYFLFFFKAFCGKSILCLYTLDICTGMFWSCMIHMWWSENSQGQPSPSTCLVKGLVSPWEHGDYSCVLLHTALRGFWGFTLSSLSLHGKHSIRYSPNPPRPSILAAGTFPIYAVPVLPLQRHTVTSRLFIWCM